MLSKFLETTEGSYQLLKHGLISKTVMNSCTLCEGVQHISSMGNSTRDWLFGVHPKTEVRKLYI